MNNPPTPENYKESLRRMPHSRKLIRDLVIERLRREINYPVLYWFMDTFPKTNLNYNLKGKHTSSKRKEQQKHTSFQDYKDIVAYISGDLRVLEINHYIFKQ